MGVVASLSLMLGMGIVVVVIARVAIVVEVARAPGVNRRQSAHKTVTHISVDLVIVLFRVDVTCHTSHVTMFVVYKQHSSLI